MKILNETIIHDGKFIQLMMTDYEDMNGVIKEWEWVRRKGNQQAVIIAATYQDKLVLIKEFRVPLNGIEIGFPSGLIDIDETPEQAAIREFKEETGLDIDEIHNITNNVYNSAGLTNESIYVVICTAKGTISQDGNEGSEDITTHLKTRDEVAGMLLDTDNLFGAKACVLMQLYVEFGCLFRQKPLYETVD